MTAATSSNQSLPLCDKHVLHTFVEEIANQATFSLMALNDIARGLGANSEVPEKGRIWYSVQAFLVAVANLSKLIWPSYRKGEQRFADREEQLEKLLQLDKSSPLKDKKMRDNFEHFDARIEEWAATVQGRPYVDQNVNGHLALVGIPREMWLRNLITDPVPMITFREKEYLFDPVVKALQEVRARAEVVAEQLWHEMSLEG